MTQALMTAAFLAFFGVTGAALYSAGYAHGHDAGYTEGVEDVIETCSVEVPA